MCAAQGFASPFWGTKKQIEGAGGVINQEEFVHKSGETRMRNVAYTPILFWSFPDEEQKAQGKFPFCKFYQVWNVIGQTTGLEDLVAENLEDYTAPVNPIEECEALVKAWHGKPGIDHGGSKAAYLPSRDRVAMPEMGAFESAAAYYHVLFHELGHSTGHRTRLERDGVVNPIRFGSHEYSEEELIAEMTAGMLAGFAGIASDELEDNSAAYLDHWLDKLGKNPEWLAKAGGAAQKASDMIRNVKWEKAAKPSKKAA